MVRSHRCLPAVDSRTNSCGGATSGHETAAAPARCRELLTASLVIRRCNASRVPTIPRKLRAVSMHTTERAMRGQRGIHVWPSIFLRERLADRCRSGRSGSSFVYKICVQNIVVHRGTARTTTDQMARSKRHCNATTSRVRPRLRRVFVYSPSVMKIKRMACRLLTT